MADDRVEIKIVADTGGFTTGMSAAKTAVGEMSGAARGVSVDVSKMSASVLALNPGLAEMAVAAKAGAAEMKASGVAAVAMGGSVSTATRELRAAFDEITSGRLHQLPGTLAIIGQRVLGLGPAALASAAGVLALAGGVYEIGKAARQAIYSTELLEGQLLLMGRGADLETAKAQVGALVGEFDASRTEAAGVVQTIQGIPHATEEARAAMSRYAFAIASTSGGAITAEKAAQEIARAVAGGTKGVERFASVWNLFNADQIRALRGSKDAAAATDILLQALGSRFQVAEDHAKTLAAQLKAMRELSEGATIGAAVQPVTKLSTGPAPDEAKLRLLEIEDRYNGDLLRELQLKRDIGALDTAITSAGIADVARLTAERKKAAEELATLDNHGGAKDTGGQQARDFQSELNAELRQQIALIDGAAKGSDQYYGRLAADAKLALAQGKITADQEIATQQTLENEKYALDLRALQDKLTLYHSGETEYSTILAQEGDLYEQHLRQLDTLAEQAAARQKAAADRVAQEWEKAFQPINTAFDGMLSGVLRGTQTWQQATAKAGQNVVISYLESGTKIGVSWLAMELLRTVATLTGAATRKAAEDETAPQLISSIAQMVGAWSGWETSKTTSTVAADTAGLAASKATGEAQVMIDAGVAAAGTMAAISAIPFVGPFMAPPMAAAAMAETMAFGQAEAGGLTGAGGLVLTHPNEMILPADITAGMKGIIAAGAGSSSPAAAAAAQRRISLSM